MCSLACDSGKAEHCAGTATSVWESQKWAHGVGMRLQPLEVAAPMAFARIWAARGHGEQETRGEAIRPKVVPRHGGPASRAGQVIVRD